MTRSAKITRFFGDGPHDFRLGIDQVEELQESLDCGLMPTLVRVTDIDVVAVKAVLRLGLIGAGLKKEPAFLLAERHVAVGYLVDVAGIAGEVVRAALQGAPDERLGELKGDQAADLNSPAANSGSATSTVSAPPSGSAPAKSAASRSGSSGPRSQVGKPRTARKTKTRP